MKASDAPGKPPLPPITLDPTSGELLTVQIGRLGDREAVLFGTEAAVFERRFRQCATARDQVGATCAFHPPPVRGAAQASPGLMFQALKAAYGPWKPGGQRRNHLACKIV